MQRPSTSRHRLPSPGGLRRLETTLTLAVEHTGDQGDRHLLVVDAADLCDDGRMLIVVNAPDQLAEHLERDVLVAVPTHRRTTGPPPPAWLPVLHQLTLPG